jgi:hypothetical protein
MNGSGPLAVMRGLDPRIHLLCKRVLRRWMGSSPAMTTGVGWHLRAQQTGIREENNE